MLSIQNKRDPLHLMWRRVLAGVLVILTLIVMRGVWNIAQKEAESRALKLEAQASLDDLRKREFELRTDIANLRDERGIEAELRERYDLAKEGESVVVIVNPPSTETTSPPKRLQKIREWFSW